MSECPICFEIIENMNNSMKTECGHEFHSNCFLTNVAHNGFDCPCCRKKLAVYPEEEEDDEEDEYEDEYEDEDEDEDNILNPPIEYVLEKLEEKNYSKIDFLKLIVVDDRDGLHMQLEDRMGTDLDEIYGEYLSKKKEQIEIVLMSLEDSNIKKEINSQSLLLNDLETILDTRVY